MHGGMQGEYPEANGIKMDKLGTRMEACPQSFIRDYGRRFQIQAEIWLVSTGVVHGGEEVQARTLPPMRGRLQRWGRRGSKSTLGGSSGVTKARSSLEAMIQLVSVITYSMASERRCRQRESHQELGV